MNKETIVYLIKFKNQDTKEEMIEVFNDAYDSTYLNFMKYEAEYKDINNRMLEDGWTCEKKEKKISW
jgi:hypothetical protein